MKLISAMVAVILVSGCAGMQTKPDPNARFAMIDAGKFWIEAEYATSELCQQALVDNNPLDKSIKVTCAAAAPNKRAVSAFSINGTYGLVVFRASSVEICEAFQKTISMAVDPFKDAMAQANPRADITPCVAQ